MAETNQATTDNAANSLPPLFLPKQIKKKENWRCIKLIAPSGEKKVWTSADAIGACYWKCKKSLFTWYRIQKPFLGTWRNIIKILQRTPENGYALVQLLQLLKEFFQIAGWL